MTELKQRAFRELDRGSPRHAFLVVARALQEKGCTHPFGIVGI